MPRMMTALGALAIAATPAIAQEMDSDADLIRSRDITGGPVYTTNAAMDEASWMDATWDAVGDDWQQIGEIEDIVLNTSGQMVGIVAEVGGFLDLGDKHVMLETNSVKLVPVDDTQYSFVTNQSEEQLEEMEGVDEGFWE